MSNTRRIQGKKSITVRDPLLNPSGEPGITAPWHNELTMAIRAGRIKVIPKTFVLANLDKGVWQALRADMLPYGADLMEKWLSWLAFDPKNFRNVGKIKITDLSKI